MAIHPRPNSNRRRGYASRRRWLFVPKTGPLPDPLVWDDPVKASLADALWRLATKDEHMLVYIGDDPTKDDYTRLRATLGTCARRRGLRAHTSIERPYVRVWV